MQHVEIQVWTPLGDRDGYILVSKLPLLLLCPLDSVLLNTCLLQKLSGSF